MLLNSFFTNFQLSLSAANLFGIVINAILILTKCLILKKVKVLDIVIESVILIVVLTLSLNLALKISYLVINTIYLGLNLFFSIRQIHQSNLYRDKVIDYVKNNEFYYFISTDKKGRIVNASSNIAQIFNVTSHELTHQKFPNVLFENLKLVNLNGETFSSDVVREFISNYEMTTSKIKSYQFDFSALSSQSEVEHFDGVIQPIYDHNHLIGRNIYITIDKMQLLYKVRQALVECKEDLIHNRNELYALMSLTNGVILYFDFLSKRYVATQSFLDYTGSTQTEFTFPDLMKMVHPEDEKFYIEQAQTINAHATTRIKFRLMIKDKYFQVMEDSIYLDGDDKLVSVIRITKTGEEEVENFQALSTSEKEELVKTLEQSQIEKTLDEAINLAKDIE